MNAIGNTALAQPREEPRFNQQVEPGGALITFDEGLYGFPGCNRFLLRPTARRGLFWLESTDHEPLRFLLADPFLAFDDYSVDLAEADVAPLRPQASADIAVLVIVTLAPTRQQPCTANTQGPLALNVRTGQARQIIVNDPSRGIRAEIDLERL